MKQNKINNTDKRSNSDLNNSLFNEDQSDVYQPSKQQRPNIVCCSAMDIPSTPNTPSMSHSTNLGHFYYNPMVYNSNIENQRNDQLKHEQSNIFNPPSPNLNNSWKNAFQMTNINMPSLPDYFSQLPSVSMPSIPNISIPSMPSMPTLTMPSIPNLSMPNISMPSMPNITFPSFSNFIRKNIKSWEQICASVKESRKKISSVCPTLPFNFKFRYDSKNENLRIYFLASVNSLETNLYYCDVNLLKDFNESRNDEPMKAIESNDGNEKNTPKINKKFSNQSKSKDSNKFNVENDFNIADSESDIENIMSSTSSSSASMSLSSSSSNSNDSYIQTSIDPTFLRKSITSPTSSISNVDSIEWKPLVKFNIDPLDEISLEPNTKKKVDLSNKTCSQEEDLILQRKRMMISGIFSYDFDSDKVRFVFTMKNAIYWFDDINMLSRNENNDEDTNETNLNQSECAIEEAGSRLLSPPYVPNKLMCYDYIKFNATFCPYKSDLVAYIADYDLWVCDLASKYEFRLTNTQYSKTAIMAGRPSFVMQEEFSRFEGFWWRPKGSDYRTVFTILCEFVDESIVETISISSWDGSHEVHRFPRAGSINAKSSLKLVHFAHYPYSSNMKDRFRLSKIEDLRVKFELLFPEYEYLIRCDWINDDVIWAQLLNRKQNHLAIVFVSISDEFPSQIIYEESQEGHWYNCHEIFHLFTNKFDKTIDPKCDIITVGSKIEFLWSSEIPTNFRHLYKITIEIVGFPKSVKSKELNPTESSKLEEFEISNPLRAKIVEHRQMTNGNWEISDSFLWVDNENDLIYFTGSKDSPLENHLYVVSSSQSSKIAPRRLSKEDFTHTRIVFDPKFKFCIDFQSNLTIPPFGYLNHVIYPEDGSLNITLEPFRLFLNLPDEVKIEDSLEYYEKVQNLGPTPQIFEYKLQSGELIYGFLFKPEYMEPGLKYPVLLEIYGGPEVQLVTKSFKDLRLHRRHLIASEGYIVVGFDSRGSKHRGVEFEKHIYQRLGQVEIDDQVEALQWLAENTGFIDMNRVAIHGWSYGGYLSLMALAKHPEIFKCAIAGAPVTNWFLYDTGYTERYMGLPYENEENYKQSNVLTHIKNFPNEYNRLLIIHGLMDENVHFCHTAQLIQGLVTMGKPYSLNVYPYERHSLKKMHSSEHYEATLIYYLQQNL